MSTANIKSTAARLNALNNSDGPLGNPSSNTNDSNRASLRINTTSAAPTYNKQALISSYLGRGKEIVGPRQPGPSEGPNKQKDNSNSDSQCDIDRENQRPL
ncbi:hypothetical protein DFH28DRAFT_931553 [Melampsora americana]|nr:hypothetical protein DFH28DRAFT_931553 [Melampsora americana]